MPSDSELKNLINEFLKSRSDLAGKSYVERRMDWFDKPMEKLSPLLQKSALHDISMEDAKRLYQKMSVGGPKLQLNTFLGNGIERIRAALIYLLYGDDLLEERFYAFVENPDSEYRLRGVGRAFASTALLLLNKQEYGIWNGAVDAGLDKLGLLPAKAPGEHKGQRYIKIVSILKELQKRCGFENLSITDEFVELVFHDALKLSGVPADPMPSDVPIEPTPTDSFKPESDDVHLGIQYSLVRIGQLRGYAVWVATNDRNKAFNGVALSSITLAELPHFAGPDVLKIAKSIDVIWFKKGTAQPVAFFEIEHSTSIYSGLLRLNDVKIDYPLEKAFIVSSEERKHLVELQLRRRTFMISELAEFCQFLSYEDVKKTLDAAQTIRDTLF